jgi:hypothetical protein
VEQPNKALNKVTLTKDLRRVAKSIKKNSADNFYRPDLTKGARTLVRITPVDCFSLLLPSLRFSRFAMDFSLIWHACLCGFACLQQPCLPRPACCAARRRRSRARSKLAHAMPDAVCCVLSRCSVSRRGVARTQRFHRPAVACCTGAV